MTFLISFFAFPNLQMKFSIFHCSHFCARKMKIFPRGSFPRENLCFIGYWGEKREISVAGEVNWQNKKRAFIVLHNAIKKLHSTQFVFLHSQLVNQRLPVFAAFPQTVHEALIKLLFIAIDVFNGEVRNRFMIFPIQYFTIVGMLFYILTLPRRPRSGLPTCWYVIHENVSRASRKKRQNIQHIKYLHAISLYGISGINLKFKHCKSEVSRELIWRCLFRAGICEYFNSCFTKRALDMASFGGIYNWQSTNGSRAKPVGKTFAKTNNFAFLSLLTF